MSIHDPRGMSFREVAEESYEQQAVRVVQGRCSYGTDLDDLWDALTSPERLPRWFLPIEGELVVGGRYQLKGNAGGVIKVCEPPNKLEVTWEFGASVSWLQVNLESDQHGTCLELRHLIPKDEASEKHWQQYGPGATGIGWDLGLLGLDLHLKGQNVEPEALETWLVSEPGKIFITECAQGWLVAHQQSGADKGSAAEMAEHCIKFYTGA